VIEIISNRHRQAIPPSEHICRQINVGHFISTTIAFFKNLSDFKMHIRKKMRAIPSYVMKSPRNNVRLLESQGNKM
jgi:hypothetical protein